MQNAQNLMSSFEFIAALMSIIIGLGVTNCSRAPGARFTAAKKTRSTKSHCPHPRDATAAWFAMVGDV
jgi:hypothetical protein